MKNKFLVLSAAILVIACKSKPEVTNITKEGTTEAATTVVAPGASELGAPEVKQEVTSPAPAVKKRSSTAKTTGKSADSNDHTNSSSANATSTSANEAKAKKKGWNKTAKGAVIGGATGAAAGAVINKKNHAAGAVVGGVVGAGTGAIIGHEMDKKDGRHK